MNAVHGEHTQLLTVFLPWPAQQPGRCLECCDHQIVRSSIHTFGDVAMKIYAGNLASTTTEAMLQDAFAAHGTVATCRIATDKATGTFKNFGFIEMANDAEANSAISALNGSDLGGNAIRVNESQPKPEAGRASR
jgi:RNA recognition motif-containing protein